MRNMADIFIGSMRQHCSDNVAGCPSAGYPFCANNAGNLNGTAGHVTDIAGASGGKNRSAGYANDNRRTYLYSAFV